MIKPLDNEPASSCNDAGCLVSGATGRSSGIATTEDNLLQSGSADEDLKLELKKAYTKIEELESMLEEKSQPRSTSNVIVDDTEQRKEKILQELQKTQSQLAILTSRHNGARNKHYSKRMKVEQLKTVMEGRKEKEPFDRNCYYWPRCVKGAKSCHGWDRYSCVDFGAPKGDKPAGPRHKDWTKDDEEEKDRWKKKKAADAVKKCNARKRQMQSGTMVALNQEERTQGKLHVAFGVLLLTSILN